MGDYNINLLNYENHQPSAEVIDQLHYNSFFNKQTHTGEKHSATLITCIYPNSLRDKGPTTQGIIYFYISDHFPIIHIDYPFQVPEIDAVIMQINVSPRNKQAFHSAVSDINYEALYISGNAQESLSRLHATLLKLFNTHFPKQSNRNTKPGNGGCQNHWRSPSKQRINCVWNGLKSIPLLMRLHIKLLQ